jgi:hypothetical protein
MSTIDLFLNQLTYQLQKQQQVKQANALVRGLQRFFVPRLTKIKNSVRRDAKKIQNKISENDLDLKLDYPANQLTDTQLMNEVHNNRRWLKSFINRQFVRPKSQNLFMSRSFDEVKQDIKKQSPRFSSLSDKALNLLTTYNFLEPSYMLTNIQRLPVNWRTAFLYSPKEFSKQVLKTPAAKTGLGLAATAGTAGITYGLWPSAKQNTDTSFVNTNTPTQTVMPPGSTKYPQDYEASPVGLFDFYKNNPDRLPRQFQTEDEHLNFMRRFGDYLNQKYTNETGSGIFHFLRTDRDRKANILNEFMQNNP